MDIFPILSRITEYYNTVYVYDAIEAFIVFEATDKNMEQFLE